jgi:4-amino-4-deoxy-L-arabinose transferase-like glycosyltransferase
LPHCTVFQFHANSVTILEVILLVSKLPNSGGNHAMEKFMNQFTRFVNISLRLILIPVLYAGYSLLKQYILYTDISLSLLLLALTLLCFASLYYCIKNDWKENYVLAAIVILALVLRIGYVLSINNKPVSDFGIIYDTAEELLMGNTSSFRGSGYLARYPHLTIMTLYYSFIRKVFMNPLIMIKMINSIFSTINVFLIYGITKECFNDKKKSLWSALITAIYPPLIIYNAAYNTENIAIPFYLASCYVFVLVMNNKKSTNYLLLSGLLLVTGHLFRMVGQVIIVAFLMYVIIYLKKGILEKAKSMLYILCSFILPLIIVSNLLIATGITEFQLWKGSEPSWTSVLKGTNLDSDGRWNEEDDRLVAKYNFDYDKVADASKEIIKQRLATTPTKILAKFYLHKFTYQWIEGDFSASYWAQRNTDKKDIMINIEEKGPAYYQLFFFVLMFLSYIGLYNKNQYLKNPIVNLFYIIFCGYALLFLITESQDRYSFIVCWLFIIFSCTPDGQLINEKLSLKKNLKETSLAVFE